MGLRFPDRYGETEMELEKRKQELAQQLSAAQARASREAEQVRSAPNPSLGFVQEHLRKYILAKLLLSEDCMEDELRELMVSSLKRTMKLDQNLLRELDTAAPCNNVSTLSAKKILLLYAVVKDIAPGADAAALVSKTRVSELAQMVHALLNGRAVD